MQETVWQGLVHSDSILFNQKSNNYSLCSQEFETVYLPSKGAFWQLFLGE